MCLSHCMCLYHVMMTLHFLNDVTNTKIKNDVIITSLKSKTMGKLMNRIPGSCLLISSLPGSALRTHVESLGKPLDVNKHLVNLISKDTHLEYLITTVFDDNLTTAVFDHFSI